MDRSRHLYQRKHRISTAISDILKKNGIDIFEILFKNKDNEVVSFHDDFQKVIVNVGKQMNETLDSIMTEIATHDFNSITFVTQDEIPESVLIWRRANKERSHVFARISGILKRNGVETYEESLVVTIKKIVVSVGEQSEETLDAIMREIAKCYFGVITLVNQEKVLPLTRG